MAKNWYIRHKGKVVGPATSAQLKQLAVTGKITPESEVRLGEDGEWVRASSVQGLWTQLATTKPVIEVASREIAPAHAPTYPASNPIAPVRHPTPVRSAPPVALAQVETPVQVTQKACMFCGETIAQSAVKCRHCNEFLDGRPRESKQQQQAPQVIVTQNVGSHNVGHPMVVGQSSALGGLLSFLIPGLGQLCTGRPLAGMVWFGATLIGYLAFILPGLVLHIICIVDAAKVRTLRIG